MRRAQSCQTAVPFQVDREGKPRAVFRRRLRRFYLGEEEPDGFAGRVEDVYEQVNGGVRPAEGNRLEQRTAVSSADGARQVGRKWGQRSEAEIRFMSFPAYGRQESSGVQDPQRVRLLPELLADQGVPGHEGQQVFVARHQSPDSRRR